MLKNFLIICRVYVFFYFLRICYCELGDFNLIALDIMVEFVSRTLELNKSHLEIFAPSPDT